MNETTSSHEDSYRATISSELLEQCVVLDMASPYVYIGTLKGVSHGQLILDNCDVHDMRDSKTTRELYVLDSRNYGVRANRKRVYVRRDEVVSISLLDDVIS